MRTAPKVITVTAASILMGLTGMASVANTTESSTATRTSVSQPLPGVALTPSSPTDDEMSTNKVDSTRRFTISNYSTHVLTISDIWGTTGWHIRSRPGSTCMTSTRSPGRCSTRASRWSSRSRTGVTTASP